MVNHSSCKLLVTTDKVIQASFPIVGTIIFTPTRLRRPDGGSWVISISDSPAGSSVPGTKQELNKV